MNVARRLISTSAACAPVGYGQSTCITRNKFLERAKTSVACWSFHTLHLVSMCSCCCWMHTELDTCADLCDGTLRAGQPVEKQGHTWTFFTSLDGTNMQNELVCMSGSGIMSEHHQLIQCSTHHQLVDVMLLIRMLHLRKSPLLANFTQGVWN